ncbi:hypothetical protein [Mycobacterium sp. SMC-4]|uniref:hypothetical protein n=1 Tax=Mycobacterium sp. SMC-4 TaxID=2857059 RepID=UPI0021B4CB68|nr:hypothetical protein [Mycobacterium sp. SMC-4]UXA20415.1 hypothetical protein KXD98_13100 [Mycobacterium sp. SMC-4]
MMRPLRLWQRNLIGTVVIIVALAVVITTDLVPKWSHYRSTMAPAAVVPARQSLTVEGQSWSIAEVRHLGQRVKPLGTTLPAGTVVTAVTVRRDGPVTADPACVGVLTDGHHRWRGQPLSRYNIKPAGDAPLSCAQPGPLQWAFLIPEDVVPTAVDVTTLDGSIAIRLQL